MIYCSLTFCVSNIWYVCLWMPVCSTSKISTNETKIKRLSMKQFFICWNAVAQKLLYFDAFPFNTYLRRQQKFGWENILFMNVHLNLSSFFFGCIESNPKTFSSAVNQMFRFLSILIDLWLIIFYDILLSCLILISTKIWFCGQRTWILMISIT